MLRFEGPEAMATALESGILLQDWKSQKEKPDWEPWKEKQGCSGTVLKFVEVKIKHNFSTSL